MKGIFRNLDIKDHRLHTGLKRAHDHFYHKLVKGKREELGRKVDSFMNKGRSETRKTMGMDNNASANYLTPFERK